MFENSALSSFLASCSGPGKQVCNAAGSCTMVGVVGSEQVRVSDPNVLTMFAPGLCADRQDFSVDFYRNSTYNYISTGGIFQLKAGGHPCTEVVVHNLTTCHARKASQPAPHFLAQFADAWADTNGPGVLISLQLPADDMYGKSNPYGPATTDASSSALRIDKNCPNSLYTRTYRGSQYPAIWGFMWQDFTQPGYNQSLMDCSYRGDSCSICRIPEVGDALDRCGSFMLESKRREDYINKICSRMEGWCPELAHRSEESKVVCHSSDETAACVKKLFNFVSYESCQEATTSTMKGDHTTEMILDRGAPIEGQPVNDKWPLKKGKGAPPQSNLLVLFGENENTKADVVSNLATRIEKSPLLAPLPVFMVDFCHSPENFGSLINTGHYRHPSFRWDEGQYFPNLHAMKSMGDQPLKSIAGRSFNLVLVLAVAVVMLHLTSS